MSLLRHRRLARGAATGADACGRWAGFGVLSLLVRPVDVDARIPGTGVLGEQRAAARDKPFDVGRFGPADDHLMPLITHGL
jgi:hypothetical protein